MALDWDRIQSTFYGNNPSSFTLSQESVKLLLSLLSDYANDRDLWTVGENEPTDAEWDDIDEFISGLEDELMTPEFYVKVRLISDQGQVHTSTNTKVLFDDIDTDLGGNFDDANHKIIIPQDGQYSFYGCITMNDLGSANNFLIAILSINSVFTDQLNVRNAGGSTISVSMPTSVFCSQDDEVELYVFHTAGSDRTIKSGLLTWFSAARL